MRPWIEPQFDTSLQGVVRRLSYGPAVVLQRTEQGGQRDKATGRLSCTSPSGNNTLFFGALFTQSKGKNGSRYK